MLSSVSLPIELLRTHPRLMAAGVILLQAVLWLLVPLLFYASPPGELPQLLAEGRRFAAGGPHGPPLAFWLGEIAFRMGGIAGVYLLSQLCVAAAFAAVFLLSRSIVGEKQAALAVVAMAAMVVFVAPAPEFGPAVLSMPLWALLLLHVWLAVWRERRLHWLAAGAMVGLLILTSHLNLWLVLLLLTYLAWSSEGRAQLGFVEPFIGLFIALVILFPQLIWLDTPGRELLWPAPSLASYAASLLWLAALAILAHLALLVLLALACGWLRRDGGEAPAVERRPVVAEGRRYILVFAIAPLSALLFAPLVPAGVSWPAVAPLILLSVLAVVVVLGDRIQLANQRLLIWIWLALMLAPVVAGAGGTVVGPWMGVRSLQVSLPSAEMGRHVASAFERRTGRPLRIVTGEPRLAALVAFGAPGRPQVFDPLRPQLTPSVGRQDIEREGAVVVWRSVGGRGLPPAGIGAQFPGLVVEMPQAFDGPFGGPAIRLGWSVVRPKTPIPAK